MATKKRDARCVEMETRCHGLVYDVGSVYMKIRNRDITAESRSHIEEEELRQDIEPRSRIEEEALSQALSINS